MAARPIRQLHMPFSLFPYACSIASLPFSPSLVWGAEDNSIPILFLTKIQLFSKMHLRRENWILKLQSFFSLVDCLWCHDQKELSDYCMEVSDLKDRHAEKMPLHLAVCMWECLVVVLYAFHFSDFFQLIIVTFSATVVCMSLKHGNLSVKTDLNLPMCPFNACNRHCGIFITLAPK